MPTSTTEFIAIASMVMSVVGIVLSYIKNEKDRADLNRQHDQEIELERKRLLKEIDESHTVEMQQISSAYTQLFTVFEKRVGLLEASDREKDKIISELKQRLDEEILGKQKLLRENMELRSTVQNLQLQIDELKARSHE